MKTISLYSILFEQDSTTTDTTSSSSTEPAIMNAIKDVQDTQKKQGEKLSTVEKAVVAARKAQEGSAHTGLEQGTKSLATKGTKGTIGTTSPNKPGEAGPRGTSKETEGSKELGTLTKDVEAIKNQITKLPDIVKGVQGEELKKLMS